MGVKEELWFKIVHIVSPGLFWWAASPEKLAAVQGTAQERAV